MARNDGMVQMKASRFYTRNSPTNGAILHGDDRDAADVVARFPYVTEADAAYLESEGLAERFSGTVPADEGPGDGSGLTVDERAGVFTEHHAEAEDSVDATTGLATRQSTVFEKPLEALAGAGGANRDVLVADDNRRAPAREAEAPAGSGRKRSGGRSRSRSRAGGRKSATAAKPAAAPAAAPAGTGPGEGSVPTNE